MTIERKKRDNIAEYKKHYIEKESTPQTTKIRKTAKTEGKKRYGYAYQVTEASFFVSTESTKRKQKQYTEKVRHEFTNDTPT